MADEEELPQYEVDLAEAKEQGDVEAVKAAKVEARYQRWLARGGPRESTFEKVLKEHGVVPGRFLEQWLLDRWLEEVEGAVGEYDQWVAEADEAARAAQKESV